MVPEISFAPCVNLMPLGTACDCSVVTHHIQFPPQRLVWSKTSQGWLINHIFQMESLKPIQSLQSLGTCMAWPCFTNVAIVALLQSLSHHFMCKKSQEETVFDPIDYNKTLLRSCDAGWISSSSWLCMQVTELLCVNKLSLFTRDVHFEQLSPLQTGLSDQWSSYKPEETAETTVQLKFYW